MDGTGLSVRYAKRNVDDILANGCVIVSGQLSSSLKYYEPGNDSTPAPIANSEVDICFQLQLCHMLSYLTSVSSSSHMDSGLLSRKLKARIRRATRRQKLPGESNGGENVNLQLRGQRPTQ